MRELRTHENNKFKRFFSHVREAAAKRNSIFFVDSGEGREIITDELEGEDLFGWLVPDDKVEEFEKDFKAGEVPEKWIDLCCFAIWERKGDSISIKFKET